MSSNFGKVAKLFQIELELHLLQNDRGKYLKNTLIGYVNVNSSCDKTADFQIIIQSLPLDYFVLREIKLDKYGPDKIEIKIVLVLLSLLEGELFVKELVTSN